ncbi:hypothetical protein GCM10022215_05440 [Nocardioides fonticola]|uniref:Uncharacterized protein n=1 Tax=Nocardioides fonticola TaxID=450363 RepID=A0ABP7XCI8_9ACTN
MADTRAPRATEVHDGITLLLGLVVLMLLYPTMLLAVTMGSAVSATAGAALLVVARIPIDRVSRVVNLLVALCGLALLAVGLRGFFL